MEIGEGFPTYSVSNLGQIKNNNTGKILKPCDAGKKMQVCLVKDGKKYSKSVHLLVMRAFVGDIPDGLECRHLDCNFKNNELTNLKYGTRSENSLDAVKGGTHNFITNHPLKRKEMRQ